MKDFYKKLEKVGAVIEREKPQLHFFGLVHKIDTIDSWELMVCSDQLHWAMPDIRYVDNLLKKHLRLSEKMLIIGIVILPLKDPAIQSLMHNDQVRLGKVCLLLDDIYDRAFVLRSSPTLQKAS